MDSKGHTTDEEFSKEAQEAALLKLKLYSMLRDRAADAQLSRSANSKKIEAPPGWFLALGRNLRRVIPENLDFLEDILPRTKSTSIHAPLRLDPSSIAQLAATLSLRKGTDADPDRAPESCIPDAIGLTVFTAAMIKEMGHDIWQSWAIARNMTLQEALDATKLKERAFTDWVRKLWPNFLTSEDWTLRKDQACIPMELVAAVYQNSEASRKTRAKKGRAKQKENESVASRKYGSRI